MVKGQADHWCVLDERCWEKDEYKGVEDRAPHVGLKNCGTGVAY